MLGEETVHQADHLTQHHPEAFGREADAEAEIGAAVFTHALNEIEQDPGAVFQRAAIFVSALIDGGTDELAENIAMRAMQFDTMKTRRLGPSGSGDEIILEAFHTVGAKRLGPVFFTVRRTFRRPVDQVLWCAHAGMVQLDDRVRAGAIERLGQSRQAIKMMIAPYPHLAGKADPALADMAGAGRHGAETALAPLAQPGELILAHHPVCVALQIGQRSQHEAV